MSLLVTMEPLELPRPSSESNPNVPSFIDPITRLLNELQFTISNRRDVNTLQPLLTEATQQWDSSRKQEITLWYWFLYGRAVVTMLVSFFMVYLLFGLPFGKISFVLQRN